MPKEWYDFHSLVIGEEDNKQTRGRKEFNKQIIADKKPYFMIYIYPQLKKEYRRLRISADNICRICYRSSLDEIIENPDRTEEQEQTVRSYYRVIPVSEGNGVMNRLCRYVERQFNGFLCNSKIKDYDFRQLLVSENYEKNSKRVYDIKAIKELYEEFKKRMKDISIITNRERHSEGEVINMKIMFDEQFRRDCEQVCVQSERLCDIILKLCYKSEHSKRFVWAMCGEQLVTNLLKKRGKYSYFVRDDNGNFSYGGEKFDKKIVTFNEGGNTNEFGNE